MANNLNLGAAAGNAQAAANAALCNGGSISLYSGVAQPATVDTGIGAATRHVTLTFAATAISGSPAAGVATYAAIGSGVIAVSGTPTWFRVWESNGTTGVMDGTIGLDDGSHTGFDGLLDAVPLVAGATLTCSAGTYTVNLG